VQILKEKTIYPPFLIGWSFGLVIWADRLAAARASPGTQGQDSITYYSLNLKLFYVISECKIPLHFWKAKSLVGYLSTS
jgi:hypothetical protein